MINCRRITDEEKCAVDIPVIFFPAKEDFLCKTEDKIKEKGKKPVGKKKKLNIRNVESRIYRIMIMI